MLSSGARSTTPDDWRQLFSRAPRCLLWRARRPALSFALGPHPVPRSLTDSARSLSARELMWITRHGIKMSGMPAWEYRLNEEQRLAVTAFVAKRLPRLSVPATAACEGSLVRPASPSSRPAATRCRGARRQRAGAAPAWLHRLPCDPGRRRTGQRSGASMALACDS